MNASQQRVGVLLEQSIRLKTPLFQRPYVWTRDNWEPLWVSVRDIGARLTDGRSLRAHFLGAVVLEQEMVPPGRIGDVRQIIDGQQRLTTIQLLLAVLRDRSSLLSEMFLRDGFARLMFNHTQDPKQRLKVIPTTDDLEPYERLVTAGSALEVRKRFGSSPESLFAQCYLYFESELADWLKDQEPSGALETLKATSTRVVYENHRANL